MFQEPCFMYIFTGTSYVHTLYLLSTVALYIRMCNPHLQKGKDMWRLNEKQYHTAKSERTKFHTLFFPSGSNFEYFSTKPAIKIFW